jgi:hypothetical protein
MIRAFLRRALHGLLCSPADVLISFQHFQIRKKCFVCGCFLGRGWKL